MNSFSVKQSVSIHKQGKRNECISGPFPSKPPRRHHLGQPDDPPLGRTTRSSGQDPTISASPRRLPPIRTGVVAISECGGCSRDFLWGLVICCHRACVLRASCRLGSVYIRSLSWMEICGKHRIGGIRRIGVKTDYV